MTSNKVTKKKADAPQSVLMQYIDIRQVLRMTQSIENWRAGMRSAESIINPTRRILYTLYEDIKLDGHLESCLQKRINAITNLIMPCHVHPAKERDIYSHLIFQ